MEKDNICRLFHNYNFDNDIEFRTGFSEILNRNVPPTPENLLQAKLFYFSKKFNKITANEYSRWLKDTVACEKDGSEEKDCDERNSNMSKGRTNMLPDNCVISSIVGGDLSIKETSDCKNADLSVGELCKELEIKTVLSDKEEGATFGQVVDMISKGLPLPGVSDLGIVPLDIEPTTTRMERKAKPWEQG